MEHRVKVPLGYDRSITRITTVHISAIQTETNLVLRVIWLSLEEIGTYSLRLFRQRPTVPSNFSGI